MKKQVSIVSGPSSSDLANGIAKLMNTEAVPVESRIFSDGECKLTIKARFDERICVIIQSTYPPTDRHLLQTLMIVKKCVDDKAAKVIAVIPYLAYARQDRAFSDGEIISIALVARLLEACGTAHLLTVDIHSERALSYFTIPARNVSSIPLLADYARNVLKLSNPLIVSPDYGGITRAAEFARLLNTDMIYFEKSRDLSTGEVIIKNENDTHEFKKKLEGRDVLLIDDMISSGSTIAKACDFIKKNGANKVHALCVHALLGNDMAQKMKNAGIQDIIATNSIPNEFARVDLSPLLLDTLNKIIRYL